MSSVKSKIACILRFLNLFSSKAWHWFRQRKSVNTRTRRKAMHTYKNCYIRHLTSFHEPFFFLNFISSFTLSYSYSTFETIKLSIWCFQVSQYTRRHISSKLFDTLSSSTFFPFINIKWMIKNNAGFKVVSGLLKHLSRSRFLFS